MKYLKIQTDLLKAADDWNTKRKRNRNAYYEIENYVCVIIDGNIVLKVPHWSWYLDAAKIFDSAPMNCQNFLEGAENAEPATDTHIAIDTTLGGKKTKLRKFKAGEKEIYIDEKKLAYFDLDNNPTFKGTDGKSPFYIYENGDLQGLVLPVRFNG